jgi:membrane protein YdbS with pleckstrin-like domain
MAVREAGLVGVIAGIFFWGGEIEGAVEGIGEGRKGVVIMPGRAFPLFQNCRTTSVCSMVKSRCLPVSNHQKEVIVDERKIFAIERPHRRLWKLYLIRSILTGPAIFISLPLYWFRYHTLRYSFDEEGIHMRWGILFRQEINLTYARIQDIHLTAGFIQRWLGLADVKVQTASGNAGAELTIEGMLEFEEIRTFLYSRMRGLREGAQRPAAPEAAEDALAGGEALELLRGIHEELRGANEALGRLATKEDGDV